MSQPTAILFTSNVQNTWKEGKEVKDFFFLLSRNSFNKFMISEFEITIRLERNIF